MDFSLEFNPDNNTMKLNEELVSLHCHHYNCGLLKAVEEIADIDGPSIFVKTVAEEFYKPFKKYLAGHLSSLSGSEILEQAAEFYRFMGFGKIDLSELTQNGGTAYADSSFFVIGWLAKYGRRSTPICYFACGFIAAVMAAAFDKSVDSYDVMESQCMISGDERCKFLVSIK